MEWESALYNRQNELFSFGTLSSLWISEFFRNAMVAVGSEYTSHARAKSQSEQKAVVNCVWMLVEKIEGIERIY